VSLFRSQAIEGQRRQLYGDVTIYQPTTFATITGLLIVITISAGAFLSLATFARKETAPGWIVPEAGMAEAYAPAGAIVQEVAVRPGQQVKKGQVLAILTTELYGTSGAVGEQERRQTGSQISEVDAQIAASRRRQSISASRLQEQAETIEASLGTLERQKVLQERQRNLAQAQYDNAMPLVRRGFISKFDQDRREQAVLTLEQAVNAIDRDIRDQRSQAAGLRSDAADSIAKQGVEESELRARRANLRVGLATLDYRSAGTLRAPVSGTVAAVNVRAGETAKPNLPIASIAPPGRLSAELLLPTRASGFIRPGQSVRLLVDAFPFQKYGSITGVVEQISRAAVSAVEYSAPIKFDGPVYRVRVRIEGRSQLADGLSPKLQPGMTLEANVVTDRRTAMQWFLDPLVAAEQSFRD